jgi:hypothetical protein
MRGRGSRGVQLSGAEIAKSTLRNALPAAASSWKAVEKLLRGGSCSHEGLRYSANAAGSGFTRRIPCAGSRGFGTQAGAASEK